MTHAIKAKGIMVGGVMGTNRAGVAMALKRASLAIALMGLTTTSCSAPGWLGHTRALNTEAMGDASETPDPEPGEFDPFRDAVNTAMEAAELTQSAETEEEWRTVAEAWLSAIEMMKAVPETHPRYEIAQQRGLEKYPDNLEYAQSKAGTLAIPTLTPDDDKLTQVDFGEGWPFIIDGEVQCETEVAGNYTVSLVTLNSADKIFAVNSPAQARATERGWLNINDVWADSPLEDGKAPLTWVIMRGESLCQGGS